MTLRSHQTAFQHYISDVIENKERLRDVVLEVTPGGGKSAIPQIATRLIDSGIVDKIMVVVPRQSLQEQLACDFEDISNRSRFNHSHSLMEATNDVNPSRGTSGFVTTYHAVVRDSAGINLMELRHHRYLLILDEVHHVAEGDAWHHALQPLVDAAVITVHMTGTAYRGDRKPIAFLPYAQSDGGQVINHADLGFHFIRYGRGNALREQAIIPAQFIQQDGSAEWLDENGSRQSVTSIAEADDLSRKALFTAVRTEFAKRLLLDTIDHWQAYRREHSRSKCLVVAANISLARKYTQWLGEIGVNSSIATSDDSDAAKSAIRSFKYGCLDVLVTVQMAYEGLNVPQITHLACLTLIRSVPWLEQMFARATRHDIQSGPYAGQMAFAWVPDDLLMNEVIEMIRREQELAARDLQPEVVPAVGSSEQHVVGTEIVPISSQSTRRRACELDSGQAYSYDDTQRLLTWMASQNLSSIPLPQAATMVRVLGERFSFSLDDLAEIDAVNQMAPSTPKQRVKALREGIERHVRRYAFATGQEPGAVNRSLKQMFGKSRGEMTESQMT